jgi:hydroxymethylglutaryl-CoA lyase
MIPDKIILNEVGLREGFQNLRGAYNTELKLSVLDGLLQAGVRHIQLGSFVHPEILPQMADAEVLFKSAPQLDNVIYSAFILNEQGLDRAIDCSVKKVETSMSMNESYGFKNTRMKSDRAYEEMTRLVRLAHRHDISIRVGLQCVWGVANEAALGPDTVLSYIDKLMALDPDKICLADTAGLATPKMVKEYLDIIIPQIGGKPLVLHFHETRQGGLANIQAALQMGVREFDSSLGGLGGSPFMVNTTGNFATEDIVNLMDEAGIDTGIDMLGLKKTASNLKRTLQSTALKSAI